MEISAINNGYNVVLKSQYDNSFQNDNANSYATDLSNNYQTDAVTDYPAYMDEGIYGEEQKSSSNMLGLVALGTLAVAGLGYGIYKHKSSADVVKELQAKKDELAEAVKKANEAEEKKKTAETALATANQKIKELEDKLPKSAEKEDVEKKVGLKQRLKNWWNKFKPGSSKKS